VKARAVELQRRREALLAKIHAERRRLGDQHAQIADALARADGWLSIARRATPVAAIGAIALGLLIGPRRIVRALQVAALPALLMRQIFVSSAGQPDDAPARMLRWFGRRR
jgi:hypothetical protein